MHDSTLCQNAVLLSSHRKNASLATCSTSPEKPVNPNRYDCSSISFHILWIFSLFAFAFSLFLAVRSNRSARRHLLTSVLAALHPPSALCRNPWAWHSSSAAMTSSQPEASIRTSILEASGRGAREKTVIWISGFSSGVHTSVILGMEMRMHRYAKKSHRWSFRRKWIVVWLSLRLVAGKIADFHSGSSPLPPRPLGSFARPASHTLSFSLITSKACSDRDGTATDYCEEAAR